MDGRFASVCESEAASMSWRDERARFCGRRRRVAMLAVVQGGDGGDGGVEVDELR